MNRNIKAFNFLIDYTIGTLWQIKEELWKTRVHSNEHYDSNRTWHPGLSIQKNRVVESYELIPILHGTSKGSHKTSVVVKGITKYGGSNKQTYFGRIFAPMQIADFTGENDIKTDKLVGYKSIKTISVNSHKPKINDKEMQQLENWMQNKGL